MIKIFLNIFSVFFLIFAIFNFSTVYANDSSGTADGMFKGAQNFIQQGESQVDKALDEENLIATSNFIFNTVLAIAMITAVTIGLVIGIKFMMASALEQAKIKELLVPYVVSCIVVFGAIGIWKLAIFVFADF